MEFGTFLLLQSPSARPSQEILGRGVELAQAAEDLGFHNIWLAEHHFSTYGYLSRPLTMALHIADKTRSLRVGTAVIVVPLHHPLVIAEEIATVDQLSGGRLDVGLGRGYQRYEFERLGMRLDETKARWEEAIDIILKAFTGEPFSYQGEYYSFPETSVFPQPLQRPHPPIWVVGQSPESVVAGVRRGFNVVSGGYGMPVERLEELGKVFRQTVEEVEPPTTPNLGVQRAVYVTEDAKDARQAVEQARWNMRVTLSLRMGKEKVERGRAIAEPLDKEVDADTLLDKYLVIGTPETCIKQIERLGEQMGVQHFNCSFWIGDMAQDKILRSMELFSKEVMPHFNERVPAG